MNAKSSFKFFCVVGLVFLFVDLAVVSGQFDGGGTGGLEGDIIDAVNAGGGINDAFGVGLQEDLLGDGDVAIPQIPNQRDQTFVGASASSTPEGRAEFRFVGTISEAFVGDAAATGPAGGQGGFAGAGGLGAGGLGAGGLGAGMNGFRVQRPQAIRSRVVPGFSSRPLSPNFVSTRFNQRISNLPVTRDFADSVRVTMQGQTAIITGTALNPQQIDRVTRQLRLDPGVSKIINQAEVGQ